MIDTLLIHKYIIYIINCGSSKKYKNQEVFNINLPKKGLLKYFLFYIKSNKILASINPMTIIAADLYSLPSACSLNNKHIVYDSREIYTRLASLKHKKFTQSFWSLIEHFFITKTTHVFVTARSDKLFLIRKYKTINITVLKNFPSISIKSNDRYALKKFLNIDLSTKIFLYQGVIQKGRGIRDMIRLLKFFDFANCVIIGDGNYKKSIKQYIKKNNLSHRVHFIKTIPYKNLLKYTAGADIGFALIKPLSLSYINALPNKIFEYILSGIPVLASNLPELKSVFKLYDIGKCVNPNNMEIQLESIKQILNTNYTNLQEIALNNFVWEKQTMKFIKAIKLSH